ncbi:MAG TPA: hypothetical protein VFJ19_04340 [Nocardioidaceae bacterium]|nr:hypothetical protein [Nocardioidaceae bacterium]
MARLNVYMPDDLARRARDAGLNISALTQGAVVAELDLLTLDAWLDELPLTPSGISHESAMAALDAARTELDAGRG